MLGFTITMVMALLLAGCSGNGTKQEGTNKKNEVQKEEEAVITFWTWGDYIKEEDSPGLKVIREFNEKYKGKIRVEPKFITGSEYSTAMQAAISSNDMPDIFEKHGALPIRTAVDHKMLLPLDDILSKEYLDKYFEGAFLEGVTKVDGKIYTLPRMGAEMNHMLYYNKDVLKEAGLDPEKPPTTWAELREMAKVVTDQGKGDVFGIVFGLGSGDYATRIVQGFSEGISPLAGSKFDFLTGKYNFDKQAWTDSVQYLVDLKEDGSILPSSYNLQHSEAGVLFGSNKAAFIFDARWRMWQIKRDTPDANFGVTHVPTPDGSKPMYGYSVGEGGWVVSAKTKYPEAVGIFLEEGIGSPLFHQRSLQTAVGLTPFPEINQDQSNYAYPQVEDWIALHDERLVLTPDPVVRNPEVSKVYDEIGNIGQSKIKPGLDEILISLMMGAEKDIIGKLTDYTEKMNNGLQKGIDKLKKDGVDVDIDNFIFPNWQPGEGYQPDMYGKLQN